MQLRVVNLTNRKFVKSKNNSPSPKKDYKNI